MRKRTFGAAISLALAVTLSGSGCAVQTSRTGSVEPPTGVGDAAMAPYFLEPSSRDYYPPKAKELGLTGRVGLECSVDERGYARNIAILESAGPLLDNAAREVISDHRFRIPPDWSATGGPGKRFRYGVIFRLIGKPNVAPFEDNRPVAVITSRGG
jgi:TonB family protein